jgi:hypothetical protein
MLLWEYDFGRRFIGPACVFSKQFVPKMGGAKWGKKRWSAEKGATPESCAQKYSAKQHLLKALQLSSG